MPHYQLSIVASNHFFLWFLRSRGLLHCKLLQEDVRRKLILTTKKRFCREIKVLLEKVSWKIDLGNFDTLHAQVSVWITAKWAKIYWLTSLLALRLNVKLTWSRNITNLDILEEITRSLLHRYTARWSPLGIFPNLFELLRNFHLPCISITQIDFW